MLATPDVAGTGVANSWSYVLVLYQVIPSLILSSRSLRSRPVYIDFVDSGFRSAFGSTLLRVIIPPVPTVAVLASW